MEDKKAMKDKELENVTGGGGLNSYITLEYCPMCKADRKVEINVDPQGQKRTAPLYVGFQSFLVCNT